MTLANLIDCGRVTRWHTHRDMNKCGENNAEHQWKVAMIYASLFPDVTVEELMGALTHDVGEKDTGDLPYGFKQVFQVLAGEHAKREGVARFAALSNAGVPIYAPGNEDRLKLCDLFADWEQMMFYKPRLKNRPEWSEHARRMMEIAARCDVYDRLIECMREVYGNA